MPFHFKGAFLHAKQMRRLRRLSAVPRWCVVRTLQNQNVAEHSFHVIWIALWLVNRLPDPTIIDTPQLILRAMCHDEDEAITGDIPSPSKESHIRKDVSVIDTVVKIADTLEAGLFLHEEMAMGNTTVGPIMDWVASVGNEWASKIGLDYSTLYYELVEQCDPAHHPAMEGT
jgi:hypothetical protein